MTTKGEKDTTRQDCKLPYSGFFSWLEFSLFNFSWVDILAFGTTLHRICIVEEILEELILAL